MPDPTPHRCDNCDGIDPGSCINADTPRPDDVPDEWVRIASAALTPHLLYLEPPDHVEDGSARAVARDHIRVTAEDILAAVAPLIARQIREQIAAELRAYADAHRRVVARKPSEYDDARLARARTLDDAAVHIARGEGR